MTTNIIVISYSDKYGHADSAPFKWDAKVMSGNKYSPDIQADISDVGNGKSY